MGSPCFPLYRRLRFAEVDFNRAEIGLAQGGWRWAHDARETANIRHASTSEQQVSHTCRAGDESGFGDRAHEGRRVGVLRCPAELVTKFGGLYSKSPSVGRFYCGLQGIYGYAQTMPRQKVRYLYFVGKAVEPPHFRVEYTGV